MRGGRFRLRDVQTRLRTMRQYRLGTVGAVAFYHFVVTVLFGHVPDLLSMIGFSAVTVRVSELVRYLLELPLGAIFSLPLYWGWITNWVPGFGLIVEMVNSILWGWGAYGLLVQWNRMRASPGDQPTEEGISAGAK